MPHLHRLVVAATGTALLSVAVSAGPASASSGWHADPGPESHALRLDAVSADRPDDAWAVGIRYRSDDPTVSGTAVVERWDGSTFSDVAGVPSADEFTTVSARTPTNVWVGGFVHRDTGSLKVWHYDGSGWSRVTSRGLPHGLSGTLLTTHRRVVLAGRVDVGAAGRPAVLATYHGGHSPHWTRTHGLPAGGFFGGTARTAHDVWAVGGTSQYAGHGHPLLAHWDGRHWTATVLRHRTGQLAAIAARSHHNALAVGGGIALRWNGHHWHSQQIGKFAESSFTAVVTAPHGTYWAANGTGLSRAAYIHFVGGRPHHFHGDRVPGDAEGDGPFPHALGMADVPGSPVTLSVGATSEHDGLPTTSVGFREQTSS